MSGSNFSRSVSLKTCNSSISQISGGDHLRQNLPRKIFFPIVPEENGDNSEEESSRKGETKRRQPITRRKMQQGPSVSPTKRSTQASFSELFSSELSFSELWSVNKTSIKQLWPNVSRAKRPSSQATFSLWRENTKCRVGKESTLIYIWIKKYQKDFFQHYNIFQLTNIKNSHMRNITETSRFINGKNPF